GLKKRKLVLNRETVMQLERDALGTVIGGADNLVTAIGESAAAGGGVSGAVSAVASAIPSVAASEASSGAIVASAAASGAVSVAGSAVTGAVDHVSQKVGLPCWVATSLASASVHFSKKWRDTRRDGVGADPRRRACDC